MRHLTRKKKTKTLNVIKLIKHVKFTNSGEGGRIRRHHTLLRKEGVEE